MEHRNGARIVTNMPVELYLADKNLGVFISTNVGAGGFYLSKYKGDLHEGDFLTVKLVEPSVHKKRKLFERKAMVVHKDKAGVGLMWADSCNDFLAEFTALRAASACSWTPSLL